MLKNNNKDRLKLVSFAMFALVALNTQQVQARTWQEIQQSGVLKVGLTEDYAPMSFRTQSGKLVGFAVDMTSALAKSLHLKVQYVKTTWPSLSQDLADDKFDLAAGGVTRTKKRAEQFLLSDSVAKNGKIILSNCHNKKPLSILTDIDKPSVKVIVNPGGTNQAYVNKHIKHADIILTKNNFANLQGIRDRSADAMITDLIEGHYYQVHEKGVFCVSSKKVLAGTSSVKVYMMKKDNNHLLKKVNNWLHGSEASTLAQRWGIAQ
ncbi:Cyclohexadienyl dehydratase precursor [Marinomonas spartinae]|uniref:Cyclohexadienyl dehydratase n=1 Tax=Marinomonas spartinae TaxID=1792290 RepID=A0A1A8TCD6_9GAMM|nr:transporter substrate-binding domain-containing protein [Marinomonas spartinae]SBS29898.1 Cyclohexadienyl dehydratase precursor [Marinomonas spartinae]SBS37167.1 Cyclohexadienyl dehydratase precursor [Marinomonas spartinae]